MIRIVQCLCPARHCILGFVYVPGLTAAQKDFGGTSDITLDESNAAPYLQSMVEHMIKRGGLDPFCGLCRSRDFRYEDQPSVFKTLEEAYPVMRRLEEEQRRTREFFRASQN